MALGLVWIETHLAAGPIPFGQDFPSLQKEGIRAILTLTEHPLPQQVNLSGESLDKLDLTLFHAGIVDHEAPSLEVAHSALAFIAQMQAAGRPVYLHCHAGIGRTGTMLHAYYLAQGLSLKEAQAKVKAAKPTSQYMMLTPIQKAFLEAFAQTIRSD